MVSPPSSPQPVSGPDREPALAAPPAPTVRELFNGFLLIGLSGFGGVLPHARHALIDRKRWMTEKEFADTLALGQALPGPNIVNMGLMMGYRFRGIQGAFACVAGLMAAPMAIVLVLATVYAQYAHVPMVQKVTAGVAFAGAGLIFATGVRMVLSQARVPAVWALAAATVGAKIVLGWSLLTVLAALTPVGLLMAWRRWI